jgi:hypothetical protein
MVWQLKNIPWVAMSLLVLHLTGVESALKTNSSDVTRLSKSAEEFNKVAADAPKGADVVIGSKRKRSMLTDEDTLVLSSVTDVVNNVVEAIRSTKVDDVHPDLYSAVMFMSGFSDEAFSAVA